jgi:DNA-binding GntR family transcriptional regulator
MRSPPELPASIASATRYARVAQAPFGNISVARYPVGTKLPTEAELEAPFRVSRHTVRASRPALIPADLARLLKVRPRTPALRILRHYYDSDGRILQVSFGYEGRFRYNTRMRVQHHG